MKILLKFPTRSRPSKFLETLRKYVELANHPEQMGIAVSCDVDDPSMAFDIYPFLSKFEWKRVFYSENKNKIQACNANMNEVDYDWDILILVSDDMVPQVKGYDDIVRTHGNRGNILWFDDGFGRELCTQSIMGRDIYNSFGYIYHPEYKSFFCDNEFTDLCKGELASKCVRSRECIIKHVHPGNGFPELKDELYKRNGPYFYEDYRTYLRHKKYTYDWSILIPTLKEREDKYNKLHAKLVEQKDRICPDLKIQILAMSDNRELSVGIKRQKLLQNAEGKYMSFVDDDDDVTDAYFEDAKACIQGGFDVARLRGKIGDYTFTHSLYNVLWGPAAKDGEFLRPPNHLNIMLKDLANTQEFKDMRNGEDTDWAIRLSKSNYLQTEYQSDHSRIHYIYNIRYRIAQEHIEQQKNITFPDLLKLLEPVPTPKKPTKLRFGPKGFVSK